MKKLRSCIIALLLFICMCFGISFACTYIISNRSKSLVYYNKDNRNFCYKALREVFTEDTIPVFGSSEVSGTFSVDEASFPQILFHNGASDFNIVLIGRSYMQDLQHAINVGAMADIIPNQKAALILSPQWFIGGVGADAFSSRFSERMYVQFLKNDRVTDKTKQAVTNRVKSLLTSYPEQLERVEEYERIYLKEPLDLLGQAKLAIYDWFMDLKQEVSLIKETNNLDVHAQDFVKVEDLDFDMLLEMAEQEGQAACTNNDFYIHDEYYETYVKESLEEKHNDAARNTFLAPTEYEDFKLFLTICKETGIEPLIIGVPVNGFWYDWTGFPKDERARYYQDIRDLCKEYDVKLADFFDKEYEPYFLNDIMHMGWKGWVYLDEAIYEFYKETD